MTMLRKVNIWSLFLVIIVLAGMLCACAPDPERSLASEAPSGPADKVELIFFHRTLR
jgi:hypothetical protein